MVEKTQTKEEITDKTFDYEEEETKASNQLNWGQVLEKNALPFDKDIRKQQDLQYESNEEFINGFLKLFETISKLGNPIQFHNMGKKPQLLLVGEMGNGKSTTGNACLKELLARQNKKLQKSKTFQSSKSAQAVTTTMKMKFFRGLNIMDTPGFNDPKKVRSDKKIMSDILKALQNDEDMKKDGLAAILQCVMIPQSGRIQKSAIQVMSKLLQIFTLSYPDSTQVGPRILIIFTNFSKFDGVGGSGDLSYDEEDEEQTEATQGGHQNPEEGNKIIECTMSSYIQEFKQNLVDCLAEDQTMTDTAGRQRLVQIVTKLFPDENFFAFKTADGFSKERVEQEKTEICRLIGMVADSKVSYRMSNEGQCYLQPVLISNDCRDELISNLEKTLAHCKDQTARSIKSYMVHSHGERSVALDDIYRQISAVEKKFKSTLIAKPYSLQKASSDALFSVKENMKRFNNVCQVTLEQEITKFSKKEAEQLRREMQERHEKERERERQMVEKLQKELELQKEEQRKRLERRRKNVYNPRFADKRCWGCGVSGHLVYWCPEVYN